MTLADKEIEMALHSVAIAHSILITIIPEVILSLAYPRRVEILLVYHSLLVAKPANSESDDKETDHDPYRFPCSIPLAHKISSILPS